MIAQARVKAAHPMERGDQKRCWNGLVSIIGRRQTPYLNEIGRLTETASIKLRIRCISDLPCSCPTGECPFL
jgi:hypothetical protein